MKKMYQQFLCSRIMLPEHQRELEKQQQNCPSKTQDLPVIDEQEKEQWDRLLRSSLETGKKIHLAYLENSVYREAAGVVTKVYRAPACIFLKTPEGVVAVPSQGIIALRES